MNRLRQALQKKNVLKRAESMCGVVETEEYSEVALVPGEPNYQLPDVFLSTKILPECETYFMQHSRKLAEQEIAAWNSRVEKVLEQVAAQIDPSYPSAEPPGFAEDALVEQVVKLLGYD